MERGNGEERLIYGYFRHDKKFPHVWCPGCGNGILHGSLTRSMHKAGYAKDDVVLVSGIGCAGRMSVAFVRAIRAGRTAVQRARRKISFEPPPSPED